MVELQGQIYGGLQYSQSHKVHLEFEVEPDVEPHSGCDPKMGVA